MSRFVAGVLGSAIGGVIAFLIIRELQKGAQP